MMRAMARSPTPAAFLPKFLGAVVVAGSLAGMLLHFSPEPAAPAAPTYDKVIHTKLSMRVNEKLKEHKALMRREEVQEKAPVVHPAHWGQVLRREAPVEPMIQFTPRAIMLCLVSIMAVAGFARQALSAGTELMGVSAAQKMLSMKGK